MTTSTQTTFSDLFQRTLLVQLWNDFQTSWKFKYTLPRVRTVSLEGVMLDASGLSPVMKNNLLLGRYEVQERTFAQNHLTPADTVLEIGGAIGFIGLFCQLRLGITRYTTVEANPGTVSLLKANYALNRVQPTVWNVALASNNGVAELNIGTEFWENSLMNHVKGSRSVLVPAMTLATMIGRLDYSPSVLIMDIEGAEQLANFQELPGSVNKIIIELHPAIIGHTATYRIVADLINLGFRVEREEGGTFLFIR